MLAIKYSYHNLYNTRHYDKSIVKFRAMYQCIYLPNCLLFEHYLKLKTK